MLNRRVFLATTGAALVTSATPGIAAPASGRKLRIVVVANRYHEADGLMVALSNQMAASKCLSLPYSVVWPRAFPPDLTLSTKPRCLIDVKKNPSDTSPSATMEIWCIDDLANAAGDPGVKADAMKTITDYVTTPPDGVIAFGTGGHSECVSYDGCATMGGTVFVHDASNGAGKWSWPGYMDTLIPSKTPASFFSNVTSDANTLMSISNEMIAPKNSPASSLRLVAASDAVAISTVYESFPYCAPDKNSISMAQSKGATNIASVETTHGVIRSKWKDAPFIFITAVPNRVCHFDDEASKVYTQEFPSSHNAGVALKYVVPYFVSAIS